MLILTRRVGETLMIGDNITVTVLAVNGSQVRIGVAAPRNVEVHREEIFNRIHGGPQAGSRERRATVASAIASGTASDA